MSKTIEERRIELEDKINSKVRERDKLVIELNKTQKDIMDILEETYRLDPTKTRIKCINCKGLGYTPTEDNKKKLCSVCNGAGYNWAELFIDDKNDKN